MEEGSAVGRRRLRRGVGSAAAAGLLAILVFADTAATQLTGASCPNGERKTIEVGIVKAIGCWTESTNTDGQTIYTARWEDNSEGVDLNGFVLTGQKGGGLQINGSTREVTGVAITTGADGRVQLNSRDWPIPGQITSMGSPIKLDFVAPENSGLLLETLHFGSNSVAGALAGLSPVGTIETPVRLVGKGTGSMDLTIALAGIFTLKDKPQSVTIDLPTSSENGTRLDGFDLELKEIDAVKFLTINDLSAKYSASTGVLGGGANLAFPFTGGKGFGAHFTLDHGLLTHLDFSVHGTKIPIGGAGFLTDISGGFSFQPVQALDFDKYCKSQKYDKAVIVGPDHGTNAYTHWKCQKGSRRDGVDVVKACKLQTGSSATTVRVIDYDSAYSWQCIGGVTSGATSFDLEADAKFAADLGAAVPTPFGDIEPVRVDAGLGIGYGGGGLLIRVTGGLSLFRLPIGDAYLIINTNAGVAFGAGVGIGLPSFRNNPRDPFYLGLRLDGWVGKGHYQFSGGGKFALFGASLLEGQGLINDRAVAACWHVLGVPGGAVFRYGDVVRTFGVGCGLDDYKEQFPGGSAAVAAGRARKFDLSAERRVLAVKGAGAAPRFTLRRRDGFTVRTPTDQLAELTGDHFIVINDFTDTTNVVLKDPKGKWKVIPDSDSVPITGLQAAREAKKEKVTARIRGKGTTRTLEWDSLDRAHTRLVFTEVLPNGTEMPLLHTKAARGSKRVKVTKGSEYGKRKLRVTIIHGFGSRQAHVVDKFKVPPPARKPAPRRVSAWRHDHDVFVRWSKVKAAHGYLVEVATASEDDPRASNYVRKVSPKKRSVVIPHHPDGKRAVAKVYALNSDDKPGRRANRAFKTSPPPMNLRKAARRSAKSAKVSGGGVALRMECPQDGHCRARVLLRRGGRTISKESYQQAPDTFHFLRLKRKGAAEDLRVIVGLTRSGERAKAKARPKG